MLLSSYLNQYYTKEDGTLFSDAMKGVRGGNKNELSAGAAKGADVLLEGE